jgi:hypothetical protein
MKEKVIQPHGDDQRYARRDEKEFTNDQVNVVSPSPPAKPRASCARGRPTAATRRNLRSAGLCLPQIPSVAGDGPNSGRNRNSSHASGGPMADQERSTLYVANKKHDVRSAAGSAQISS